MKPTSDRRAARKEQIAPEISEFCRLLAKILRRSRQANEPTADSAGLSGDRAEEPYAAPRVNESAKRLKP